MSIAQFMLSGINITQVMSSPADLSDAPQWVLDAVAAQSLYIGVGDKVIHSDGRTWTAEKAK